MYALAEEEIRTIRHAIKLCAGKLTVAVNCEDRFNVSYLIATMDVLSNVITSYNEDLEGKWFSALVTLPDGRSGMLTNSKCRRVNN